MKNPKPPRNCRRALGFKLCLTFCVFTVEALDATFSVEELHFAGKKGMANVADFNLKSVGKTAGHELVSACADDFEFYVFRVNVFFHSVPRIDRRWAFEKAKTKSLSRSCS